MQFLWDWSTEDMRPLFKWTFGWLAFIFLILRILLMMIGLACGLMFSKLLETLKFHNLADKVEIFTYRSFWK